MTRSLAFVELFSKTVLLNLHYSYSPKKLSFQRLWYEVSTNYISPSDIIYKIGFSDTDLCAMAHASLEEHKQLIYLSNLIPW